MTVSKVVRRVPSVSSTYTASSAAALAWLVLFLSFAAPARAQKSPTGQAAFLRAQRDLVKEDVTDAAVEMETAVRFEPRFAFGWYLLASTSRRAGDCDRAVAAYRRYLELRPREPDPLFGIGLCLESIGDLEGAIASLRRYAELATRTDAAEFVEQARKRIAALERLRPRAAQDVATDGGAAASAGSGAGGAAGGSGTPAVGAAQALPTDPATTHASIGAQLITEHKFNEAVEELRNAVKISPAGADAWYKLAFALRQASQPGEAVKAYRRYITLKPEDPDPYYSLGQVLLASGRPDDALLTLRAYVKTEHRKTELRWVAKARAEIARLEAARQPSVPKEPKPITQPLPPTTSPPSTQPPATVQAREH